MDRLEEKKKFEKKWGWLAHLVAGSIIAGFNILRAIFKTIFSILSSIANKV